jgi:carboxypeptidase PM20D1
VFRWKGRNSNLKPILFLAHSDVVPPGELSGWESLPFSGDLNTGKIYGRGALDMKNVLFGLLEASESLMNENFIPERDVYYAFGHDEEVGGREGALRIAQYFHELGLEFDGVYDEGGIVAKGGSITGIDRDIALVGVAEKGFLSAKILVKGTGGHSSMPPLQSSIGKAAEIMLRLEKNQLPPRIIPTFGEFLDTIGSEMSFEKRIIFANRWLFDPILLYQMSRVPATNALTRTTTALTMMKGSDQSNVLSPEAELVVNFRILPGESVDDVRSHIKKAVDGFDVEITDISNTRGPSIVSRTDTIAFVHLRDTISKTFPDALISPYITIGGTDAFKYEIVSNNIYRFNPVVLDAKEQRSIHNQNEYISLENFRRTVHFYKLMIAGYPSE